MSSWDPGKVERGGKLRAAMRLIRIEHTVFSLPFAYVGIALSGYPYSLKTFILSTLAVLGLRSAGMSFNNIADIEIDRRNPRTAKRPLVTGALSMKDAWLIVLLGSVLYYASAYLLNFYALLFSPLLYAIAMTYPYAKRIHPFPHLHLGLSLGFVVFGGAIASSGSYAGSLSEALESVPWLYLAGVTLWVAGFDTLYSIMDIDYDRREGLGSIPSGFGVSWGIAAASLFYLSAFVSFFIAVSEYRLGFIALFSAIISGFIMALQIILTLKSLDNVPKAFNLNLALGIIVSVGVLLDLILK
ncbi:MAG: UbiA-like polyprenyltransferase [Fervidicoccaceae archaeon]